MAFLNAKKSQLNTGVDMIQVGDLYAATGNVFLVANDAVGTGGQLTSKNDVTITVRTALIHRWKSVISPFLTMQGHHLFQ